MARRERRRQSGRRPLTRPLNIDQRAVIKTDGRWLVRPMSGAAATKNYRCPGCQQVIPAGMAQLVVWPDQPGLISASGLEERRHWHTACWQRRL